MTTPAHNPDHYPHNNGNADLDILCRACELGVPVRKPMPGPPECVCGQCTTHECLEYPHWCAHCPVHGADAHDAASKHMTPGARRITNELMAAANPYRTETPDDHA